MLLDLNISILEKWINAASNVYCFYMESDIHPHIHSKPISWRLLKINLLETFAFSSLIFFCINFESKCTVLGPTIKLNFEGTLEISSLCYVFLTDKETISVIQMIYRKENSCGSLIHFRLPICCFLLTVLRGIYFFRYLMIIFSRLSNRKWKSKVCDGRRIKVWWINF